MKKLTNPIINWTDHGKVFSLDDISWADDRAWAPQAVERNGKFYLYCPVHKTDGGVFTNHPGIADFRGHSYLFYHTGDLPGGHLFHRSVCVTEFKYNEDGSINMVPKASELVVE